MNRLSVRLTITFLVLLWSAIGIIAVLLRDSIEGGFRDYVSGQEIASVPDSLRTNLEAYYTKNETWQGAESQLPARNLSAGQRTNQQGRQYFILDLTKTIMAASDPTAIGKVFTDEDLQHAISLQVNEQRVGWLVWQTPGQQRFGAAEQSFLDDMTTTLLAVGAGVGVLTFGVGIGLAWQLARPLRHLTVAVHDFSASQRGQQVPVEGTRETKALADAFNRMSHDLAHSEAARRRIAADVAHELRTPVTILSNHLEGMLDDVLSNSKEQLAVAYNQTLHLKRLIEDLRVLTLAEIRQLPLEKHRINPAEFLHSVYKAFEPLAIDQNVHFELDIAPTLLTLHADEGRLRQVFGNLLTNALRHTPAGGDITLSVSSEEKHIVFHVTNTGLALSDDDAVRLFDPFWRADEARDRDRGGSGLGLAITRQLIELHEGSIAVTSNGENTTFRISLPSTN